MVPALQEPTLDELQNFIDPCVVGEHITGAKENGFRTARRFRHGEFAKLVQKHRWRAYTAGFDDEGNLLPTILPTSRDLFVRQRARAAEELKQPLLEDDSLAVSTWPVGARFSFSLDMNDHENCAPFLNPVAIEVFYDAPTFQRFVAAVLEEIDKELGDLKPQTNKIRADLQWWVDHDAIHVPEIDDSWEL